MTGLHDIAAQSVGHVASRGSGTTVPRSSDLPKFERFEERQQRRDGTLRRHCLDESRLSWSVRALTRGSAAPIGTCFDERGFIRVETIAYADYVALNGETGARDAGKLRLEGKDYVVADGDVMHFRFAN